MSNNKIIFLFKINKIGPTNLIRFTLIYTKKILIPFSIQKYLHNKNLFIYLFQIIV